MKRTTRDAKAHLKNTDFNHKQFAQFVKSSYFSCHYIVYFEFCIQFCILYFLLFTEDTRFVNTNLTMLSHNVNLFTTAFIIVVSTVWFCYNVSLCYRAKKSEELFAAILQVLLALSAMVGLGELLYYLLYNNIMNVVKQMKEDNAAFFRSMREENAMFFRNMKDENTAMMKNMIEDNTVLFRNLSDKIDSFTREQTIHSNNLGNWMLKFDAWQNVRDVKQDTRDAKQDARDVKQVARDAKQDLLHEKILDSLKIIIQKLS
jgi:uncharacterized membrane-anchored protein YhcB (DUF1043 family)